MIETIHGKMNLDKHEYYGYYYQEIPDIETLREIVYEQHNKTNEIVHATKALIEAVSERQRKERNNNEN